MRAAPLACHALLTADTAAYIMGYVLHISLFRPWVSSQNSPLWVFLLRASYCRLAEEVVGVSNFRPPQLAAHGAGVYVGVTPQHSLPLLLTD